MHARAAGAGSTPMRDTATYRFHRVYRLDEQKPAMS